MKPRNILFVLASLLSAAVSISCDGEKDLIIIDGDLPIKTSVLYMVGDATPNGWSIDSPTALTASEEDELVFSWEGALTTGEIKLCITTGSWDVAFIRPLYDQEPICKTDITEASFQMHSGDPDEKWLVTDAGNYRLTFDLRNWTMSTVFLSEADEEEAVPIESDALYIVGDATPAGWSIDSPTATEKVSDYVFEWEGDLYEGEMKACLSTGSWDVKFVRPAESGCVINKDGAADGKIVYTTSPDDKWQVEEAGMYHLTFDLENYTFSAEYVGETVVDKTPIETSTLYIVGDATPAGWSMADAESFTQSSGNPYVFTWEGTLVAGEMKACLEQDETFTCAFIRPSADGVEISSEGVAQSDFIYTVSPDNKWKVTESGTYRLTFDLENYTFSAEYLTGTDTDTETDSGMDPIETSTLYIIGDATPGGWSMDDLTSFTQSASSQYEFSWEGELTEGEMKACLEPDGTFSCAFIRPSTDGVEISSAGVAADDFVYTTSPDDKWRVTEAGTYKITFNLKNYTIEAQKTK